MSDKGTPRHSGGDIKLEEVMHPAVTVTPDATEREALEILLENSIPGVPVVENDGTLVGFVTDGHLLASALPKYLSTMQDVSFVREGGDAWVHYFTESADRPVSEVMTKKVSQIDVGRSEIVAAHKMVHDGVSSVVVTEHGKVVGIVNRLDLYAAILGLDKS
jgi:CBS domain-containing protein